MLTRRQLLHTAGLGAATLGLPTRLARAGSATDYKFVFVFAQGGWDVTRVFATEFTNNNVDMEADAEKATIGGIKFVDHASRPSVRTFFEGWHDRTVVLNGMMVRSIAHEICTMIAMTGTTSGVSPDWPAVIADRERDLFTLPHLVLGGPSFPGDLGVAVARTGSNGQLEALLSGAAVDMHDQFAGGPNAPAESLVDRWMARRAKARALGARSAVERALVEDFLTATDHAAALKELQYVMDFSGGLDLVDQAQVAVNALANGVARCVTLSTGAAFGWDTHANNDQDQSPLWEGTFNGLGQLMALLAGTAGTSQPTLADETIVVVMSELGRTPQLNAFAGKDHWPYTSAMIVGPGFTGSRVIGGFDSNFYGNNLDPATGEIDEDGQIFSAEALGATLLARAGIDPSEYVMGVEPLEGILT